MLQQSSITYLQCQLWDNCGGPGVGLGAEILLSWSQLRQIVFAFYWKFVEPGIGLGQLGWRGSTSVVLQIISPAGTQQHCPCVFGQGMPGTFYCVTLGENTLLMSCHHLTHTALKGQESEGLLRPLHFDESLGIGIKVKLMMFGVVTTFTINFQLRVYNLICC